MRQALVPSQGSVRTLNPAEVCHAAHTVFFAARDAVFARSANPHGIREFVNGCLRAIEKSAA